MMREVAPPFFPGPEYSAETQPKRSRLGLILGLGGVGCLGVVGLVVVGAVFFMQGALAVCPPNDFPVYPRAQQTDFSYNLSTGTSDCAMGWESDDMPNQVTTFYETNLDSGPWQVTTKDTQTGEWSFQRRGDGSTLGRIRFLGHGTQTRIEMEVLTGQSPAPSASAG